jgi:hypothetical protein
MYHNTSNTSLPNTGQSYTPNLPPMNNSLPPPAHSDQPFYPYSQHQQPQKSTFSYSPYLDSSSSHHIQHEEYYYPVYNKHEWTEG